MSIKFFKWPDFLKRRARRDVRHRQSLPVLWEDDYCQVQIVPVANADFIRRRSAALEASAKGHYTENGFTAVYERGELPTPTAQASIPLPQLNALLLAEGWEKAPYYLYRSTELCRSGESSTTPFVLDANIAFIQDNSRVVSAIWLCLQLIVSVTTFNQIAVTFQRMGREYALMLVDWNSFQYFALTDKDEVDAYLMSWFK